jgi:hypothetical protein
MEYIVAKTDIWKLQDGTIFEGPANDLPKSNASKIAKKGMEYSVANLEAQGWKKAAPKKEAAPKKKAAPKVENKAVKPEDVEDK